MTITNRYLSILIVLAVALLTTTTIVYMHKPSSNEGLVKDSLLLQGLDLPEITKVTIRANGKQTTLNRDKDAFVVAERNSYPASVQSVNDLLRTVLDIRCQEKVSDLPEAQKDLGVADDAKTTKVEFFGKDGKSLAAVLVGNKYTRGSDTGYYVRLASGNTVYSCVDSAPPPSQGGMYQPPMMRGLASLSGDPTTYLTTQLLEVPQDKIETVSVAYKTGQFTIALGKDKKAQLQAVPAGKQAKQSDVESVFGAATFLNFEDVARKDDKALWDSAYTVSLNDHTSYLLRLRKQPAMPTGKPDDKPQIECFASVQAIGPSDEELKASQRHTQELSGSGKLTKDDVAKHNALVQAGEAAAAFNKAHEDWVYKLSEWKARDLTKTLEDLVENIPPATKPATNPATKPVTKPAAAPVTPPATKPAPTTTPAPTSATSTTSTPAPTK